MHGQPLSGECVKINVVKMKGELIMVEWIVVDQFGNQVAGPFFDKVVAEMFAKNIPNATVVDKNK